MYYIRLLNNKIKKRIMGLEPIFTAWKADDLPLIDIRFFLLILYFNTVFFLTLSIYNLRIIFRES